MIKRDVFSILKSAWTIVIGESVLAVLFFLIMALAQLVINHIGVNLGLIDGRAVPSVLIIAGLVGYLAIIWLLAYRGLQSRLTATIKTSLIGAAVAFTYFAVAILRIAILGTVLALALIGALLIVAALLIIQKLLDSEWESYLANLWGVLALMIYIIGSYLSN